jgi:hypothetical protein
MAQQKDCSNPKCKKEGVKMEMTQELGKFYFLCPVCKKTESFMIGGVLQKKRKRSK